MKKLMIAAAAVMLLFLGCPSEEVSYITVTPDPASIGSTETQQFTATAYDADSVEVDVDFTWTSSNTAVATVDENGLATAVATGTCVITAASGDVEGTADLTVTSGPTEHSGAITADETWYASANPHIITGSVSVENNATLTIEAGCIVRFDLATELYAGYNSAGAIIANGTSTAPILFTSNVATPSPGDYTGIGLYDYTMASTSFDYCTIKYAGDYTYSGAFHLEYPDGDITNCTVDSCDNTGITLSTDGAFAAFTNNTISNCNGFAIDLYPEFVRTIGTGNTFADNADNAILVRAGSVTTTGTWVNPGIPYVLDGSVAVEDISSPVLTIAPGNVIELLNDVELYVGYNSPGGLIADGTSGRITFTSAVASPSPGDWDAISFYGYSIDADCILRNCTIEYGASSGYGNIWIDEALPTVESDSIGHSAAYGIYCSTLPYPDPDSLRANNTFYDCASGDVYP